MLFLPLASVAGIWALIYGLSEFDIFNDAGFASLAYLALIGFGAFMVFSQIRSYRFLTLICENLSKSYLQLKGDGVCGYCFTDISARDSGHYFELKYSDIRNVLYTGKAYYNATTLNNTADFYNLIINHANGTCKLCIERAQDARECLTTIITRSPSSSTQKPSVTEPEKQVHVSVVKQSPNMQDTRPIIEPNTSGRYFCPNCGAEQNYRRRICFSCGYEFRYQ